jgi:hypothetical protein
VGFSGTNDNHRLLPRQVEQAMLRAGEGGNNLESLCITNGQMLECMIRCTQGYETLSVVSEGRGAPDGRGFSQLVVVLVLIRLSTCIPLVSSPSPLIRMMHCPTGRACWTSQWAAAMMRSLTAGRC